jgi:hypothetical protein
MFKTKTYTFRVFQNKDLNQMTKISAAQRTLSVHKQFSAEEDADAPKRRFFTIPTRHHIQENDILYSQCSENLKNSA